MKLLEGKVAIVTGAARGIGKAIALKFAAEGANIAFTDLVIDENGLATQKEIEALGVKAKGYASNAANFEETHNVVAEIVKDFGRCNVYTKPDCKDCFARFYCSGGCAANSYNFTGNVNGSYDIGCELQRKRIECAIMIKAALSE